MVRTWPLEQLLEVVWSAIRGLPTTPTVGGGYERALTPLLVLLLGRMVGCTFVDVLIPLRLAFEVVKDRSDRFLARGMAGGDVKELLGGSWALTS